MDANVIAENREQIKNRFKKVEEEISLVAVFRSRNELSTSTQDKFDVLINALRENLESCRTLVDLCEISGGEQARMEGEQKLAAFEKGKMEQRVMELTAELSSLYGHCNIFSIDPLAEKRAEMRAALPTAGKVLRDQV